MRQTPCVLYIAVDSLIPVRGKEVSGFAEFTAALDHTGIPAVWLTSRSRLQFDEPRRRLGHAHPFIAEDGCGVYLPADYFHLRPDSVSSRSAQGITLRLGRFSCIPFAKALPAASEALAALSEDTGVPTVTLRSLSPRELVQNTGLPPREAELARHRDFDEVFFFAGASQEQIHFFAAEGRRRGVALREKGVLWSAAIGASTQHCVGELSKLYDRALRYHAHSVAVATADLAPTLFPYCDRRVLLADRDAESRSDSQERSARTQEIPLGSENLWEWVLESVSLKS